MLPAVRVPALVLYRGPEREKSVDVAERIPAANATQVSGEDYLEIHLSPEIAGEIELADRGSHALKGLSGERQVYAVVEPDGPRAIPG